LETLTKLNSHLDTTDLVGFYYVNQINSNFFFVQTIAIHNPLIIKSKSLELDGIDLSEIKPDTL